MPNRINPFPQLNRVTHDPTITISGDPRKAMQPYPFGEDAFNAEIAAFWAMLEKVFAPVWNGVVNTINEWISWFNPEPGSTDPNIFTNLLNQWGVDTLNGVATILEGLLGTTVFQSLLDSIAVSMGHSGTGHTIADIETYLGLIPGPNIATPIGAGVVPGLDASKITSGAFAQSMITGLGASLSALLGASTFQLLLDAIANIMGHSGTGHTITDVGTYLGLIPGPNIATPIGASVVPGLDASKITSGAFAQSMITGLGASLSALLGTSTFNALVDSIANALGHAGTGYTLTNIGVYLGLIPGTNIATPVTASVVPALDASKITSGAFAQSQITNLIPDLLSKLGINIFNASATAGSNLVIDPTLEDTTVVRPMFDSPSSMTYSTDQAHSNTRSLKGVTVAGQDMGFMMGPVEDDHIGWVAPASTKFIKVSWMQKYKIEAYVFAKATNTVGGTAAVGVYFRNSLTGAEVWKESVGNSWVSGQWALESYTAAVPFGYDQMQPYAFSRKADNAVGNTYYWDDLSVRDVTLNDVVSQKASGGTNLAFSPTFEDSSIPRSTQCTNKVGGAQYPSPGAGYSTDQAHSGSQSYKFVCATPNAWCDIEFPAGPIGPTFNDQSHAFKVTPGQKYYIEAWVFPKATNIHYDGFIYARCGDIFGSNTTVPLTSATISYNIGAWNKYSGYVIVPPGKTFMWPAIEFGYDGQSGDVYYIDDVIVREATTESIVNQNANAGSNVVLSPDFEDSSINRPFGGLGTWAYSTAQKHAGTQSYAVTRTGTASSAYSYMLPTSAPNATDDANGIKVQPNQKFYFECWMRDVNSSGTMRFGCEVHDSSGVNGATDLTAPISVSNGPNAWTKYSGVVTIPAGYNLLFPYFQVSGGTTGHIYYFDDAIVREETAARDAWSQLWGSLTAIGSTILGTNVPALDASKVTTGQFPQSQTTNLVSDLLAKVGINIFSASVTAGSNLVISPDFGDSNILRPVNGGPGTGYSTTRSHSGTQSYKVVAISSFFLDLTLLGVSAASAVIDNIFKVQPNQRFYAEIWCYAETANVGSRVMLYCAWDDSNGVNGTSFAPLSDQVITKGVWTKLTANVTIPTGYDRVRFAASVRNDNTTGDVFYWDDAMMREETAAKDVWQQLWGSLTSIGSTILGGNVPALDASKITTGTLATPQIPAVTKAMSPDMQKIVDAVNQALGGGASTGTAIASMFQNLKQIPPANILINTSSATSVTQVSAGAGNKNVGNALGTISTSWTETIAATANYTVVPIAWSANIGSGAIARDVTIGGRAASSLGFQEDTVNGTVVEMFGLPNPPTGAQTIVATASYVFGTFKWISGESVSYAGWGGTTPAVTSSGSGSSPSHTVAAAVNEKIVHAFMEYTGVATGEALSAYNRTSRYNSGAMDVSGTSGTLLVGDADGGASIAFTATPAAVGAWNSIAVRLQPAGATLPSMCHVVRTTGNVAISSGANLLPNSFFAASPLNLSSDLTWDATNNKVTVSVPGNYIVEIGLANTGVAANNTQMGPVLYWGSGAGAASIFKRGDTAANAISKVSTFVIPLKANDYVRPGAFIAIANNLAGEATGTYTYMTVTLASRGLVS